MAACVWPCPDAWCSEFASSDQMWLQGCLHHDPDQRWSSERMLAALLAESLDRAGEEVAAAAAPQPQPPRLRPERPHVVVAVPAAAATAAVPAEGGQRPTPPTRSMCELCLVKTCYCIAIFFTVCITIAVLTTILSG